MVVYIFPSIAKALLAIFCNANCIHRCAHVTLSSSSYVNIVEWLVSMAAVRVFVLLWLVSLAVVSV